MCVFRACLLGLLLASALFAAGCDTTRDKNQRAKLAADRSLATRRPVEVEKPFSKIKVQQVQAVGRGKSALVVVRLTNTDSRAWAALPINVKAGGKLLNRGPEIPYFSNHIPGVAAGATTVWILHTGKRIPEGKLSAVVGPGNPNLSQGKTVPDLRAADVDVTEGGVLGVVENHSGVPQYSVEVYLTARKSGKYTAAALGRVVKLTGDGSKPFNLKPVGKLGTAVPRIALGPAVLVPNN